MTPDHEDALGILRHSSAHLMANALRRLSLTFGVILRLILGSIMIQIMENPVTAEDLPAIEAEMMKIVKENNPIVRKEISREALELFADDPYKVELITDLPE